MKALAPQYVTLAIGLAIGVSAVARADDAAPSAKPTTIEISKETTVLTEPVVNGRVDYLAALNKQTSRGVTLENNAAVLFIRAIGPREIHEELRPEYFRLLGVKPLPLKGDYLKPLTNELMTSYGKASEGPWSADEYPHLVEWLRQNEAPLSLILEGSQRSEYFTPLVGTPDQGPALIAVLLPMLQEARGMARALSLRALLNIQQGDLTAARRDLLACHRIGRLVSRNPTIIGQLVGYAIESIAFQADCALVRHPRLTAREAMDYREQLRELPDVPNMADLVDRMERFVFLDCMLTIADGNGATDELADSLQNIGLNVPSRAVLDAGRYLADSYVDWNTVLRDSNEFYDRIVAAMRVSGYDERQQAMQTLEKEIAGFRAGITPSDPLSATLALLTPRQSLTDQTSKVFIAVLCPGLLPATRAETRMFERAELLDVALTLAAYRADAGRYPAALAELTPDYLDRIPNDLFTGSDLVYRRSDAGYILYSLGENQTDDDGRTYGDVPKADDLVVKTQR